MAVQSRQYADAHRNNHDPHDQTAPITIDQVAGQRRRCATDGIEQKDRPDGGRAQVIG